MKSLKINNIQLHPIVSLLMIH